MKVHQVILTIIDFDELGADQIKTVIENQKYPNHCIGPTVESVRTREIGEWSDDNPLNWVIIYLTHHALPGKILAWTRNTRILCSKPFDTLPTWTFATSTWLA
jgi:hypothetical protein